MPQVLTLVVVKLNLLILTACCSWGYLPSLMLDSRACTYKALHIDMWLAWMQCSVLQCEYKKELGGTAADPTAEVLAYYYNLLNGLHPESQLASSPCFGLVIMGPMLW